MLEQLIKEQVYILKKYISFLTPCVRACSGWRSKNTDIKLLDILTQKKKKKKKKLLKILNKILYFLDK
jgi:hypothetical protein